MTVSLSIGIISHNRREFLPEAIASALSQKTDRPYRILIVDDASTDGSGEYLSSLDDPRISVFRRETNGGESAARNDVIRLLETDWVMWLDDDDVLLAHALESQCAVLEKNPDADIVYGNVQICDERLEPRKEFLKYAHVSREYQLYRLLIDNMLTNGGTLVKRSVYEKAGMYDLEIRRSMDYDLWARAALQECLFQHNDDFIYLYRAHGGNCINPREQDPDHHRQYANVVTKILSGAPLEKIFPMLGWLENPQASFMKALNVVALVYVKWQHYDLALDALSQAEEVSRSIETAVIRGLVYRLQGRFEQSAECFENVVLAASGDLLLSLLKLSCINPRDDFSHVFGQRLVIS